MKIYEHKIEGAPQFVSYFVPVIEAMQSIGEPTTPKEVFDYIASNYGVPREILNQTNSNGRPKFENRVSWARFYLTKAGLMFAPKRGVWALTEVGETSNLSDGDSVRLFKNVHTTFKGGDEEIAPEDEIVPKGANYWFVGATWEGVDQTARFVKESIWQNGYEDKFSKLVRQMKKGDKIAIKSSFTRKNDVPFENYNRTVSTMKIKAIGTVTTNMEDGLTVGVEWETLDPPREWYLYTYRTTIVRARVEEDAMARHLVDFTFKNAKQDFDFFLSNSVWADKYSPEAEPLSVIESEGEAESDSAEPIIDYLISDIISDGGFLEESSLNNILHRLITKKNLILQGPPGTGKTWLAKRLGKALIGQRLPTGDQMRTVQFHPSLSYEDFVRGYRPNAEGRLNLTDGLFLQVVAAARAQPDLPHVLIIEEINRGNPAQVFGEMLTLLENTKRSRADAMELAYRKQPGEKIHVPENLHVIGTMNIADRSLALIDVALRRRFAFVTLEPLLNASWKEWCKKFGLSEKTLSLVRDRIQALNIAISSDRTLGSQFNIGHSFVTPSEDVEDEHTWFSEIVETEIGPLLEEYWFDAPDRVEEAKQALLTKS